MTRAGSVQETAQAVVAHLAAEQARGADGPGDDAAEAPFDVRVAAREVAATASGRLALAAELLEVTAKGRDEAALYAVAWMEQDFRDDASRATGHAAAIDFANRTIVVRIQIFCIGLAAAFIVRSLLPIASLPGEGPDAVLYALLAAILAAFATVIARNEQARAAGWARRARAMRDAVDTMIGVRQQIFESRREAPLG